MVSAKNIWIINQHSIPPSLGGLNRHYYFSRELQKRGNKVKIFTSSAIHNTDVNMIPKNEKCFVKDIKVDGVNYSYIKMPSYQGSMKKRILNIISFIFKVQKLKKFAKIDLPDVIYTSSPDLFTAWSAGKLARKLKVPCITEVRDLWPKSIVEYKGFSENNPIIKIMYQMEKSMYKKTDALIYTFEGGKDYLKEKGWDKVVDLNKVFNVNNGVVSEEQLRQKELYQMDKELFNEDKFNIVYVGAIREVNSLGIILDAAKVLQEKDNSIRFILYGDGTQKAELEQRCKDENINNVIFRGRIDKKYVPYICSRADINLINVRRTGIQKYGTSYNKMYDYMLAGKPILCTIDVNYNYLEKYNCGFTTKSQEPEDIANEIIKIKNLDKETYEKIGKNAYKASKDFDFNVLTDKLEKVIDFAIKAKGVESEFH